MNRKTALTFALLVLLSSVTAAPAFGQQQQESRTANLYIEQPTYIDNAVTVNDSGKLPVYRVKGERIRMTPQNFDTEDVVDFGVAAGGATLDFDSRSAEYVLRPSNTNGSIRLFWIVEEERLVNRTVTRNNSTTTVQETDTVRVKYEAVVTVERTDYAHLPRNRIQQMRSDAENWTSLVDEIKSERIAGPNANVEDELESALSYLRLLHHPLTALTGEFTAILLSLFITLGGLLVLALFGLYHIWATRFEKAYVHRIESLEAEREDIDQSRDELIREKREKILANLDWQDLGFPDHVAAAFRQSFGETVLEGWMALQEMLLPEMIIRDRLEAMGKVGYEAAIDYDDVATDGGEDEEAVRAMSSARILPREVPADVRDDEERVAIDDLEGDSMDQLVEAVSWDDEELLAFSLPDADLERDELSSVLESQNYEQLIAKIEEQVGEGKAFDNREEYLEYLVQFAVDIRMHEFTDEHGAPKPVRYMLETWLKVAQITSDRYNFPFADYTVENLQLILMNEDIGADVARYVDEVEAGKHG